MSLRSLGAWLGKCVALAAGGGDSLSRTDGLMGGGKEGVLDGLLRPGCVGPTPMALQPDTSYFTDENTGPSHRGTGAI